ncbi:MAG TPA: hypothetical protein VIX15_03185 [Streptosporangiaceae bacterium]
MNHDLTGIGPRSLPQVTGLSATGRALTGPTTTGQTVAGQLAARGLAFAVVAGVLAFAAGPVRHLTGPLPAGTRVAGAALLAASVLCYLKVMYGALAGAAPRSQVINVTTLTLCTVLAPIPLGRSWLALGFMLPAAAGTGIRWSGGPWLGLGALPAAFATAIALGESAGSATRAVAQDALIAAAVTAVVMLAARSDDVGRLKTAVVTLTDNHADTEQRLRQADDLLGILGWRLSVISRMSDLIGRMAADRPGVARQVLGDIHRLAREWPRSTASGPAPGGTSELSAEIEAVRLVLGAAGIGCDVSTTPEDLPDEVCDLLAFAIHEAAFTILGRRDVTSGQITIRAERSRVRLTVACDGAAPDGPAEEGDAAGGNGLADRVAGAGGQSTGTEGDRNFRLDIDLPLRASAGQLPRPSSD